MELIRVVCFLRQRNGCIGEWRRCGKKRLYLLVEAQIRMRRLEGALACIGERQGAGCNEEEDRRLVCRDIVFHDLLCGRGIVC